MGKSKSKGPSVQELEDSLRKKKFESLYLLHGEEDFLIDEITDLLIEQVLDESTKNFNLDIVQGGSADARDIVSLASAFPMMADRRIVIVRGVDRIANKDPLVPYVENPSPSTILVFISEKPDLRLKFYKALEQRASITQFDRLYENKVLEWIGRRIEKLGRKATAEACQLIQSYVGRSLREIQNEIDKLFIYVGDKKVIAGDDVNAVVGMSKQYNIFELQKAIGQQQMTKAAEIMERMLDAGESLLGMVVMLTRYFQKLWLLQEISRKDTSDYQLASSLGVSPFFLKEYLEATREFSSARIVDCFEALLSADETLKSSSTDFRLVGTLMLHRLLRGNQNLRLA